MIRIEIHLIPDASLVAGQLHRSTNEWMKIIINNQVRRITNCWSHGFSTLKRSYDKITIVWNERHLGGGQSVVVVLFFGKSAATVCLRWMWIHVTHILDNIYLFICFDWPVRFLYPSQSFSGQSPPKFLASYGIIRWLILIKGKLKMFLNSH